MLSIAAKRVSRISTLLASAIVLAGCFGEGDGPTRIAGTPAPPAPPIPPGFCDPIFNFEDACGGVSFNNFEGGDAAIIDNPDMSGINTSDKVARMLKFPVAGGGTFGGTAMALTGGIDFSAGEAFTMKVWSSRSVPVLFKFEGLNQERSLDHSGSGMWEEFCYDFTGTTAGPAATDLTIIFDITVMGASDTDPANWTFYFDDVVQVADCAGGGGGGTPVALPVTFEDGDAAFYELTDFGGAATTLVADPADAANTVASSDKFAGSEVWAGTTVAESSGFGALPFTATDTSMTLRVYSPDAAIPVRLKVEDRTDNTISVETEAMTTAANTWETLTFDFSNEAAGTAALDLANTYDKASVFFNFGTDGNTAGDKTYLWDDLAFGGGGGGGGGNAPTTAAPAPTQDSGAVISLFADGYANVSIDAWPTSWSSVTSVQDVTIDGNTTKEHLGVDFVGIETTSSQVDASGMTHLHVDLWTPDATEIRLKLVDFGADMAFDGGDDSEHELTFDTSGSQGQWISLDIPLGDFTGLTSRSNIAQYIIAATPPGASTIYLDNLYFYDDTATGGSAPTAAPPAPTQSSSNVISLLSGAFTDVTVDTWRTDWSSGDLTDIMIDGQDVKQYTNLDFVGIETVANQIDATGMTHFHVDVWTPNADQLRIKLVDFGADGGFDGGDDTEGELVFDSMSTPALNQGQWVSLDIPLADFEAVGLTTRANIAQFIFAASPPGDVTLFVTNMYFYNDAAPSGTVLVTFDEATPPTVNAFGGAITSIEAGPAGGDGNALKLTRDGGDVFAGAWVPVDPIPNDQGTQTISALVYSPLAGIPMVAKVEFGDNMGTGDTQANEAVVVGWQTLTWTFTNLAAPNVYNRFVILPNLGVVDTATDYFIDNITLEASGGGGGGGGGGGSADFVNGDFETGDFTGWVQTLIPDAVGSIAIDNSGQGGRTGSVARLITDANATQTNDVLISQVALAAGTVTSGDSIDVSFDLYGTLSGAGGVVFVEIIFLDANGQDVGGRDFVGPAAPYVPTTTWTNYSGTVIAGTATGGGQFDVSGGVTLQLKAACGAIDGCGVDASFDNVTFTVN